MKKIFPPGLLVLAAAISFFAMLKMQKINPSEPAPAIALNQQQNRITANSSAASPAATLTDPSLLQTVISQTVPQAQAQQAPVTAFTPNLDPVTLRVPSIQLTAPIISTGLETDGSLHVPSSPDQTGWYDLGTRPGDIGPAVITGHLDSALGPGVLYHLKNIKAGDEIDVIRNDGSTAVFTVDRLDMYPQNNFNTQAVYGSITTAGLRVITCAGTYNRTAKRYSDDLVVFATLQHIIQPAAYQPG